VYVCAVRHPELVSGSHEILNMKRDAEYEVQRSSNEFSMTLWGFSMVRRGDNGSFKVYLFKKTSQKRVILTESTKK